MLKIERQLHFHMNENTNIFCCLKRFAFNKHFYEISEKQKFKSFFKNLNFFSDQYFFRFAYFTYHNFFNYVLIIFRKKFNLIIMNTFQKIKKREKRQFSNRFRLTAFSVNVFFSRKSNFKFDTINQFDLTRFNI